MWNLVKTQGWVLAVACVLSVAGVGLGLVPFACVAAMAGAIYATPADLDSVRTLAWVAAGAIVARHVVAMLSTALAHVAAYRLLHDLRVRLAHKLGDVPLTFFATRTTGQLKQTLMEDVNQIEAFIAHHLPDAVAAFTVPPAIAVLLLAVDWRMALASIAVAPLAFGAMQFIMRDGAAAHVRWRELADRTSSSMLEYLRGIHVIKTFGLTAKSFGDLRSSIEEGVVWTEEFMTTSGRGYGTFGALVGSSIVVLLPLGGWLHLRGSLGLSELVLFLVLGPQLLGSLLRLMFAHGNLQRIQLGNQRIAQILATAPLATVPSRGVAPRDASVELRDVGFEYVTGAAVLDGVSFVAHAGEVTALVGPSGAGKTTIARLVPRLWEPARGSVAIGGVDVRELPLDEVLARVAVVFQDVFLFHGSVRDNLRLGKPDATDLELEAACRAARVHDAVAALPAGYDTILGERGARLSGGERQRLSIARAMLKAAPIVVLDEATAFADPENEAAIQDALAELCRGRTVIVIAHRLATVAAVDQIVVLDRGRVVDHGRHADLLGRCTLYQQLWRDQSEAREWALAPEVLS